MLNQAEMLARLIERTRERRVKYQTEVVDEFPRLTEVGENVTLGSFSWLLPASKRRLLARSTALLIGGMFATPGDVARDYLREKFPKRGRVTTDQYQRIMKHRHAPLVALPGALKSGVYIDIKAAYWSIIKIAGWDVDYNPGRWLGRGADMSDFPYDGHKLARNVLATAGLYGRGNMWLAEEQRLITVKRYNKLANYSLWSLIQDVLNAVAVECLRAGAIYVHTDGFICDRKDADNITSIIQSWGLQAGVKWEGVAQVFTAGTYAIGPKPNNRKVYSTHVTKNLCVLVNGAWLKRHFTDIQKEKTE